MQRRPGTVPSGHAIRATSQEVVLLLMLNIRLSTYSRRRRLTSFITRLSGLVHALLPLRGRSLLLTPFRLLLCCRPLLLLLFLTFSFSTFPIHLRRGSSGLCSLLSLLLLALFLRTFTFQRCTTLLLLLTLSRFLRFPLCSSGSGIGGLLSCARSGGRTRRQSSSAAQELQIALSLQQEHAWN